MITMLIGKGEAQLQSMTNKQIADHNRKFLKEIKMTDDDILSVEDLHMNAKMLNIRPYNLGCDCEECNKEFNVMINRNFDAAIVIV